VVGYQGDLAQQDANLSKAEASLAQANENLAQNRAQVAQAQQAEEQAKSQLVLAQANLSLAKLTADRYRKLAADGAIDQQTADQTWSSYETNKANVDALTAAVEASKANVDAFMAGVRAGEANVKSFADGVTAAQAAVRTAQANVMSARAAVNASLANVNSNQANLTRSIALQGYDRIVAPFDGVITARNVDNGGLISAGGGGSAGSVGSSSAGVGGGGAAASGGAIGSSSALAPSGSSSSSSSGQGASSASLFSESDIATLRVYVNVPQDYFTAIQPGINALITVQEYPHHAFSGIVARTASSLDPSSRTLVTEVDISNPTGMLRPGMFSNVILTVPHVAKDFLVPDSALFTNASGISVATLAPGNKIHFVLVQVGRDQGQVIEVSTGLTGDEQVVTNPTTDMYEGESVRLASQPAGARKSGAAST